MDLFYIISNQLFQFLVMMVCGYIAARRGILAQASLDVLSKVIIGILLPILIFANAMNGTTRQVLFDCYAMILLSAGIYGGLIIVQAVMARLLGRRGNLGRIYQATMIYGNVGFLGIPLLSAAFPERGGLYIALFSIIDQLVLWTYGMYLTTPGEKKAAFSLKKFFNPALCAIVLAIVLILAGIGLPNVLETSLLTVGRAATPLSLLYLGGLIYYTDWSVGAKTKDLYAGIATKMLLFPVAFFLIARSLCGDLEMVQAATLIAALPTMAAVAMFAQSNRNHGDYALSMVLLTTVACLGTMTVVAYLMFNVL